MRLKCIKLAGFKSFVDPTTALFPTNLSAVVGPNGCGKSNIIDAVRWVMGESSAKNLRGESMTDVIFNGSGGRKPVGQASIELVFDNSDGSLGGEYGAFSEIAIRRKVTREGKSEYYLNGSKCRRRDITDIFLGTGLGPRSYAIIEQGMISRLIESKPEELRVFIEEAAGISKYKERRRETENRMRRTHENLERLTDIREELERQLANLKRQAASAERYKNYKQEERELKAQLQAMQWQQLDDKFSTKQQLIGELEAKVEACVREQTRLDSEIEKHLLAHGDLNENFNGIQARFYSLGADIARIEQTISHQKERDQQLNADLEQTRFNLQQAQEHLALDCEQQESWQQELLELEPEIELLQASEENSTEVLLQAEEAMQNWQQQWDQFNQQASGAQRQSEVQSSKIQQLEAQMQRLNQRLQKLNAEMGELDGHASDEDSELLQQQVEELAEQAEEQLLQQQTLTQDLQNRREKANEQSQQLDQQRSELQRQQGRLASLEALQQAAMGQGDAGSEWLQQQGLAQNPRLADQLYVADGWDKACETVLGQQLQAVCLDDFSSLPAWLDELEQGRLSFVDQGAATVPAASGKFTPLLDKVSGSEALNTLLAGIYLADNLNEALAMRPQLASYESVVCRDGIWLGANWLRVAREEDAQAGMLARKQEIETLHNSIATQQEVIENLQSQLLQNRQQQQEIESQQAQCQQENRQLERQKAELQARLSAQQAQAQQLQQRQHNIRSEIAELNEQQALEQESVSEARLLLEQALDSMAADESRRQQLQQQKDSNRQQLDNARHQARQDKDRAHQLAMRVQDLKTRIQSSQANVARAQTQVQQLSQRQAELQQSLGQTADPAQDLALELEALLEKRLLVEDDLSQARQTLSDADTQLRQAEKDRTAAQSQTREQRQLLEHARIESQALQVERAGLEKQLAESEYQLPLILEQMPDEAEQMQWQQRLDELAIKIQRLGAINLAAIEEYKIQSERKEYLDAQNDDLLEALETLEGAIRKIDRETRARFKETFDQVNQGVQELFPKVFGGGRAYLEMTGDDLLDTGIAIMAQPPGKRNSTIHLLSGGEKALTAIALVFSIFKLNPAPFCMLDEVDAPLDDANVGRYARMVKEMSSQVQFIYISHNKIAMEMAESLLGVTMHEPGVSRLVSVDIEEAAELAAQ